eukprot:CAMPEP_0206290786 /NCGR_PEP_ID=MMETSP0106_2-20121207/2795_1 /ASSEMBLY_ACC=CAM_ASM_000206 /TAXON_ID=81532 /ORGANISM="Acanthoeca-like sp., Strain 10tr" /LENGTH=118 /DNA_ID=CAMNT_0053721349 /DNA_START=965 /DNA_END=1318 /DNA_ORIENTATION=-
MCAVGAKICHRSFTDNFEVSVHDWMSNHGAAPGRKRASRYCSGVLGLSRKTKAAAWRLATSTGPRNMSAVDGSDSSALSSQRCPPPASVVGPAAAAGRARHGARREVGGGSAVAALAG